MVSSVGDANWSIFRDLSDLILCIALIMSTNMGDGCSPSWGAKQVNHLHGFRVSGFFLWASFGPVSGGNSPFSGHKLMTVLK